MELIAHSSHFWDLSQIGTQQDLNSIFYEVCAAPISTVVATNTETRICNPQGINQLLEGNLEEPSSVSLFLSLKQPALINLGDRMYKSNSSS